MSLNKVIPEAGISRFHCEITQLGAAGGFGVSRTRTAGTAGTAGTTGTAGTGAGRSENHSLVGEFRLAAT